MRILLAEKQNLLVLMLGVFTLIFSSLSFSYNPGLTYLPSRDDAGTGSINEAQQGCVYRESDASLGVWTVDDCDYVGAHYACYNGAEWKVAQALGTAVIPGEPQDGNANSDPKIKAADLWDPIKADGLCKNYFGPAYFFSVPVNEVEDANLGVAITKLVAAKKRTWMFYYSNTQDIPLAKNYWLGNRTEFTNWFGSNPDNKASTAGIADCTLIHRDTGLWQDAACSEEHSYACYESGNWLVTAEKGEWRSGFAVCDENYSALSIYGVPRDNAENDELKAAIIPAAGTGIPADYNQVWLNRTDLAYEEFFVSNQTRRAWWGAGQPTNRNNADCTLIDSSGNWISETCNGYVAYHACYLGDNSSGEAQWQLTSSILDLKKSESELGFGYCKRIADNAEYRPPNSTASNAVLASLLMAGEFVWINYSDQATEGAWKVANQYQDFVSFSNVIDGDAKDCGYFSLETNDEGNWLAGQCYAGGVSMNQGFACTNGYEWKVATTALSGGASLTSDLWKDGFTACEAAFGKDYYFAAPAGADQNSRLSLALSLSGNTQAWLNLNDAKTEGEWVANGPVVNLSPVLNLSTQREFPEKQNIDLSVAALDPETGNNIGLTYQWSIIAQRVGENGTGTDIVNQPGLTNANTPNLTIAATDLLNDNYYLDIQLQVTDADAGTPATTTTVITIKVISPLRAAYDFNNYTNPKLDISGNNHHLTLNTSQVEITAHGNGLNDYFAKMDGSDSFSIDGSVSGLQLDQARDQYTLIYRFKLDGVPSSDWAGFVQKGLAGTRQPATFYNKVENKVHFTNSTTNNFNEAGNSQEAVRLSQWMTVAYVKNGSDIKLYIDKAELNLAEPDPSPLNDDVFDSSLSLIGSSIGYDSGDWHFGNVPDASEGIVGGFDDIRIYNRSLTATELNTIFSDQPKGVFEFTNEQESGDENEVDAAVTEILIPVSRLSGDDGIVSVAYSLVSDSAILDTDFRLKNDSELLGSPDRGKGVLTWQVHDAADKNITVELIGDTLREGTESFGISLEKLAAEPSLGSKPNISVNIVDKTPNPYGAIAIAPTTATENLAVDEGSSGLVTVERVGTDSLGAFDVIYQIEALTASSPDDFSITQAGFPIAGTPSGSVLGQGRLSFSSNVSGTPVDKQLQTISFSTVHPDAAEFDELFSVTLLDVTDPGSSTLADPITSAILGTKRGYTQVINDITPGRVRFKQATYSADEVDQGSGSNVVLISLERLAGDDGAMCVTLDFAGSTATAADYNIAYLNPSASGQTDVYWADKDIADKSVQISIVNDEAYDAAEEIKMAWVRKANCDSQVTVVPDFDAGDVANTTVSITDQTTPIKLKFTEASYSVSELTATKTLTIQATQTRQVADDTQGDFVTRSNNNTFSVYLNRATGTAVEGTHFGDLSGLQVVTFSPGETEKTIVVPIVDNCDAAASLAFGMGLLNDHASIANTLPTSLLDVSDSGSSLTINNGSQPLGFTNITHDYTGVVSRVNPTWKGDSRLYVTGNIDSADLNPEMTEMRLKANVSHNCLNDANPLVFNWSYDSASPSLPVGNGLPAGFSIPPVIAASADKTLLDKFTLPFVIRNTSLTVNLTITDNETGTTYNAATSGYSGLEHVFIVSPYFRVIENNGEGGNNCVDWEGLDSRVKGKACGSMDRQNGLAYNPNTQQLVFGEYSGLAGPGCVSHAGGDDWLYGKYCGASSSLGQRWSVTTNRVNSLDRPGIFFMESGIFTGTEPMARTDSSSFTNGAKNWTWLEHGGYLP